MSQTLSAQQLGAAHSRLKDTLLQFFEGGLPDATRKSFELQLAQFQQQPSALFAAQSFLRQSTDKYVLWYSASLLEKRASEKWSTVPPQQKQQIRNTLMTAVVAHSNKDNAWPRMVLDKALAALCTIALQDFPENYPSYFGDLYKLSASGATNTVGMRLLRFTLEEFPLSPDNSHAHTGGRRRRVKLASERVRKLSTTMGPVTAKFLPVLKKTLETGSCDDAAALDALQSLERISAAVPDVVGTYMGSTSTLLKLLFSYLIPRRDSSTTADTNIAVTARAPGALRVLAAIVGQQQIKSSSEQAFTLFVAKQVGWCCVGSAHVYFETTGFHRSVFSLTCC